MNGLVLIDKPSGCTSHDVVNRWRRIAGTRRAGHLGTLDPMATGLLLIISGTATRLAPFFSADRKTYRAEITFGLSSDTYDAEGEVVETNAPLPTLPAITEAIARFRGRFLQTPPSVSAKKVNGVAAYKLARQQIEVQLKPVEVQVFALKVLAFLERKLEIEVECSTGTYIRSIAHDLGVALGCGAVLSRLRRTAVGELPVSNARSPEELTEMAATGRLSEAVIPTADMLPALPVQHVDEVTEVHIRYGREFRTTPFAVSPGAPLVRAVSRSGDLICIGEIRYPNVYHPKVVL